MAGDAGRGDESGTSLGRFPFICPAKCNKGQWTKNKVSTFRCLCSAEIVVDSVRKPFFGLCSSFYNSHITCQGLHKYLKYKIPV